MTREEAVALLERYSNYDGMGIPNLAGCKEAMKVAVESLKEVYPELADSEDERIREKLYCTVLGTPDDSEWFHDVSKDSILAYLEKQKENPKSADSIPSDCVSDAKCEDRWHKVGDSLPDNPREVLCKDEAGNYFIGRYYVGEGWEISNYDDEDKPHHLNPPVSKWIDFPLEKQKESLHIQETCKENTDSFTDACKDVIVAIEKYLDWLTGYPDYAPKGKYSIRDMLYCLSLLEKQKEQSLRDFIDDFPYSTEQKEHQNKTDAPKEKSVGGNFLSSHKDKNLDDIAQDYVEAVKEYNPEPTWDLMQTAVCYGYYCCEQEEQKPAEWSEEDELNCNRIIRFLEPHKTFFPTKETKEEMQNWLKNRLKSLRPQYHGDVTMIEAYKMGLEAGKASSWKPSEEQIYSLGTVVKGYDECTVGSVGYHLKEMYEQLKKLM